MELQFIIQFTIEIIIIYILTAFVSVFVKRNQEFRTPIIFGLMYGNYILFRNLMYNNYTLF